MVAVRGAVSSGSRAGERNRNTTPTAPMTRETTTAMTSEAFTRVAAARPPISAMAMTRSAQPNWPGPARLRSAVAARAHCPTCGTWVLRRNVTSCGTRPQVGWRADPARQHVRGADLAAPAGRRVDAHLVLPGGDVRGELQGRVQGAGHHAGQRPGLQHVHLAAGQRQAVAVLDHLDGELERGPLARGRTGAGGGGGGRGLRPARPGSGRGRRCVAGEPADDQHHDERGGLREQRRGKLPAVDSDQRRNPLLSRLGRY